ncbi:Ig-like domain-containing protein [Arthrobacter sp. CAN_C5]|uniref:Ig-like domain-containing protein n=1 Tax=Arthrobacter sp. CAN_C5 TaxID=2760706 RepID=UPI001AE1E062|nr:Ig-like domain-containing protein [Arthrobacter sp. CAN_C5]MBP2217491.1 hypothetical protein [Arthrobacter sp. CAN_C5]
MNRQLREHLAAGAGDRAHTFPAFIDRALRDGMRAYQRRIVLVFTAAVSAVIVMSAGVASIPGWIGVQAVPEEVGSLIIQPTEARVAPGGTVNFTASVILEGGMSRSIEGQPVWESLNPGVATIDGMGLATAVSPGTATISGSSDGRSAQATLTVLPADVAVESIIVTPTNQAMDLGVSQQYLAVAQFSDGSAQEITGAVQWGSADLSVASVTETGQATGIAPGKTQITAEWNGLRSSVPLTILAPPDPPVRLLVQPAAAEVCPPTAQQLSGVAVTASGEPVDVGAIAWASDRDDFPVDASGLVSPIPNAEGAAVITAQAEGLVGTATVTARCEPIIE